MTRMFKIYDKMAVSILNERRRPMYLKIIDIMNKYQISRTSVNTMIAEMQDCKSGKHLKKSHRDKKDEKN